MRADRHRKKYRVKNTGRFVVAIVVIVAIMVGGIFAVKHLTSRKDYTDETSFKKYAVSVLADIGKNSLYEVEQTVTYGEGGLSYVSNIPATDYSSVNKSIKEDWKQDKEEFQKKYKDSASKQEPKALIMGIESSKTPYDAESITVHTFTYDKTKKNGTSLTEKVYCYNIATKSKNKMATNNIFSGDYSKIYTETAKKYLKKHYKNDLLDNYESKLDDSKTQFVLTKKGVKFYLKQGTVVKKSLGVVSFTIDYDDLSSVLRSDIGKRVIDPDKPMVAVTYDDGPSATCTPQILDILEENGAVATFFELGSKVEQISNASDILKRELSLGCELGTHTYNHPNLYKLTNDQIKEQASKSISAIEKASGQKPTIMRAPYGNGSQEICNAFGLSEVNWDVDTRDWASKDANSVISEVKKISNLDGRIILMHSIYPSTVEASKTIIPWLQEQGYQLVNVSEMLQYKYNKDLNKVTYYGYNFK